MQTTETAAQTTPVETNAAPVLDALTKRLTAFRSFAGLVAGSESADGQPVASSYFPSVYPPPAATAEQIAEFKALADAYDAAQQARGDARRCYRGEPSWWRVRARRRRAAA